MPPSQVIGIDIGGANIKLATAAGCELAIRFPMWLEYNRLDEALRACLKQFQNLADFAGSCPSLAVTMTGELADCFATRREGVAHILEHLERACTGWELYVYSVDGEFLDPSRARQRALRVAASNWHALGSWICRSNLLGSPHPSDGSHPTPRRCLLVDVGSTTVDIIPLRQEGVDTRAKTDRQRLQLGQLVYTGMQRTPVAAILQRVRLADALCPLMAERFATSDDAYLCLGLIAEDPTDCDTADGRPRTQVCAQARLARMVGEDLESLPADDIKRIAQQIIAAQVEQLAAAIERNLRAPSPSRAEESEPPSGATTWNHDRGAQPPGMLCISGHGRPLMERVVRRVQPGRVLWLDQPQSCDTGCDTGYGDHSQSVASRSAPAQAVAWLLEQALHSSAIDLQTNAR
jgi:(4-(4-[2-(gamma-L-glutamylamino)ethyl]phenoxymethyl)furan-2-yl)methanamine synthase